MLNKQALIRRLPAEDKLAAYKGRFPPSTVGVRKQVKIARLDGTYLLANFSTINIFKNAISLVN
jgi:hypothetical protein